MTFAIRRDRWSIRVAALVVWLGTFIFVFSSLGTKRVIADGPEPGHLGSAPMRGTFSSLPFEEIDMVNGNLQLTVPIFALKGDGEMDLNVAMVYSRNGGWQLSVGDLPKSVGTDANQNLAIISWSGTPQRLYLDATLGSGSDTYVTADFWRYSTSTHTLSLPNGNTATFNQGSGHLVEIHDPFGNAITPHWPDPVNFPDWLGSVDLQRQSGANTRTIAFTWEEGTRVTSVSLLGGAAGGGDRTWTFTWIGGWNGNYHLWKIVPPIGPFWQFSTAGALLSGPVGPWNYASMTVTTPNGGTVAYGFDWQTDHYAVSNRTTGGRAIVPGTWTFQYNINEENGEKSGIAHAPLGRHIEYRHKHFVGETIVGADWALVRQLLMTDSEGVLSYTDYSYTLLPVTDDVGSHAISQREIYQSSATPFVTTYEYHTDQRADFHQPYRILETGEATRETFLTFTDTNDFTVYRASMVKSARTTIDGASTTRSTGHDSKGFVTSSTVAGVTTNFTSDDFGNIATFMDANGNPTSLTYKYGTPESITTPVSSVSRTINVDGTVASVVEAGQTTSYEYDAMGRQFSETPPLGEPTFTWCATALADWCVWLRGPNSVVTYNDGFGRPTGTVTNTGIQTATSYDALGQRIIQIAPFTGGPTAAEYFTYDGLGRIKRVTHADNTFVQFNYSDSDEQVVDENGHSTTRHHRTFGTPLSGPITALADAAGQTWNYTYNVFGSLTSVVKALPLPQSPARIWHYHAVTNRLEFETQPESGTTQYTEYDSVGNLKTKVDSMGHTFRYGYDAGNRLTSVDQDPGDEYDITITYDPAGNRHSVYSTHATSMQTSTTFSYDPANRMINREDQVIGLTYNTHYDYDGVDRITTLTYPSGRVVYYGYNNDGQISSVTGPNGLVYANSFSYHPSGALASYQFGNGQLHTQSLDNRDRPWHLTSGPLDLTYGYDNVGNVSAITDPRQDHGQSFGYDSLDRLTNVSGYQATNVTYDALGNRTSKGGTTYQYDPTTLWQTQSTGIEADSLILNDPNGNRTRDNQGLYYYRPDNKMRATIVNSAWTIYQYDGEGQRIAKWNVDGTDITTRGPGGVPLSEFHGSLWWIRDSIYAGTQLLATVEPAAAPVTFASLPGTWWQNGEEGWTSHTIWDAGNDYLGITVGQDTTLATYDQATRTITTISWGLSTTATVNGHRLQWSNGVVWQQSTNSIPDDVVLRYFHLDAIGSVRAVTNMAGAAIARFDYGAFGEGPATTATSERQRFTGAERDSETFLDYLGARYYRNVLGRFNRADDPGFMDPFNPQSMNRYGYAYSNPLRWIDPTGHVPQGRQEDPVFRRQGYERSDEFDALLWQFLMNSELFQKPKPVPPPNLLPSTPKQFWGPFLDGFNGAQQRLLKPGCGAFYGGQGPATMNATQYRFLDLQSPADAAATFTPTMVAINPKGAYMTYSPNPGQTGPFNRFWTQPGFRSFVLLHELGHQLSAVTGFKPDGANSALNNQQSQRVISACF